MGEFAFQVMSAQSGRTHLFSTGQAGFIIRSAGGQLLAIDLYLSECVERVERSAGFKRLLPQILNPSDFVFDAVICTHPHMDHFDVDAVPGLLSNGKTKLFASTGCEELTRKLGLDYYQDNIRYVKPGDSAETGDFRLTFVNCDHGSGAPDAFGVVVSVDGKTIYEAGDTCLRLDRINEIPKPLNVLIAPINGAYGNLNETECAALAEALRPDVTIPCHYGMFASHHGDVGKFYEAITEKGLPFLLMRQGEQFTL